jgi:hypothetical protein
MPVSPVTFGIHAAMRAKNALEALGEVETIFLWG